LLTQWQMHDPYRALNTNPFGIGTASASGLGKMTVIYGRNGSGKSTFSELLCELAEGRLSSSRFKWRGWSNAAAVSGQSAFDSLGTIHVYNRFYVERALQTFLDGSGSAAAIVKLGTGNVAAEAQILALTSHSTRLHTWLASVRAVARTLSETMSSAEESAKSAIIHELGPIDPGRYNTTVFKITKVRSHFSDADLRIADSVAVENFRAASRAQTLENELATLVIPTLDPNFLVELQECLARSVVTKALPNLLEDESLASWVRLGIPLHRAGDTCKFCGDGTITGSQLAAFSSHFDASLTAFEDDSEAAIASLTTFESDLAEWRALLTADAVLEAFRPRFIELLEKLDKDLHVLRAWVTASRDAVISRNDRPFDESRVVRNLDAPLEIDVAPLNEVLEESRLKNATVEEDRSKNMLELERHCAAEHFADYIKAAKRLEVTSRADLIISARLDKDSQAIKLCRESQQDTGAMAVLLNADLREHFGHSNLTISVSKDSKGYLVGRNGSDAKNLSEGERNAISLLFFLRSLEADSVVKEDALVVIDDPVTSLDKESLFAAHALVRHRTRDFGQVIILTHDFEYFRLNVVANKSAFGSSQKKIKDGNSAEMQFPAIQFLEIAPESTANQRTSSIRSLPARLLMHASEYHYLFWRIGKAIVDGNDDELPLLGNAGRRLIEGFISFKAPNGTSFQEKVDTTFGSLSPKELKERIVRYLHGSSHRENPNPTSALDFPAVENELRNVFRFIQLCDPDHFERMCKAVDLKASEVLDSLATSSGGPSTN